MSGAWQRVFLLFFIMVASLSAVLAGLPDPYKFSLLNSKDSLSHSQGNCFLKDTHGYLWIGTAAGLNCYDGYRVKPFSDSLTINTNDINKLFKDFAGNIWSINQE